VPICAADDALWMIAVWRPVALLRNHPAGTVDSSGPGARDARCRARPDLASALDRWLGPVLRSIKLPAATATSAAIATQ
jgi:hypothetical protein